jgi:hypothetical protein
MSILKLLKNDNVISKTNEQGRREGGAGRGHGPPSTVKKKKKLREKKKRKKKRIIWFFGVNHDCILALTAS